MKYRFISVALAAVVLLLGSTLSLAADNSTPAPQESASKTTAIQQSAKSKAAAKRKAAAKIKPVDINSADKAELKKLPGIGDAEADKIIAGRPYLSKTNLVTHNILSGDIYEKLKALVIAKPNQATAAKLDELQKARKKP